MCRRSAAYIEEEAVARSKTWFYFQKMAKVWRR